MAKYSNFIMRVKCTVYTDRDYSGHTVGGEQEFQGPS